MLRILGLAAKHRGILLLVLVGFAAVATLTFLWLAAASPLRGTTSIEVLYHDNMPDGDRRLLDSETISDPVPIAGIVDAIHRPHEEDIDPTKCPFTVVLRFRRRSREIALVGLATDGCYVAEVWRSAGLGELGGRTGRFVPGNESLEPFVSRHGELMGRGRASDAD
jgi:hypothetical protein